MTNHFSLKSVPANVLEEAIYGIRVRLPGLLEMSVRARELKQAIVNDNVNSMPRLLLEDDKRQISSTQPLLGLFEPDVDLIEEEARQDAGMLLSLSAPVKASTTEQYSRHVELSPSGKIKTRPKKKLQSRYY